MITSHYLPHTTFKCRIHTMLLNHRKTFLDAHYIQFIFHHFYRHYCHQRHRLINKKLCFFSLLPVFYCYSHMLSSSFRAKLKRWYTLEWKQHSLLKMINGTSEPLVLSPILLPFSLLFFFFNVDKFNKARVWNIKHSFIRFEKRRK